MPTWRRLTSGTSLNPIHAAFSPSWATAGSSTKSSMCLHSCPICRSSPTNAVATASSCSRAVSSSGSPMPSVSRSPDARRYSVSCRFLFRNGNASAQARQSTKSSTRGSTPEFSTSGSNLARRSVTTSRPMSSVTCAASVGSATCRASGASCVFAPDGSGSCSTSARLAPMLECPTRPRESGSPCWRPAISLSGSRRSTPTSESV